MIQGLLFHLPKSYVRTVCYAISNTSISELLKQQLLFITYLPHDLMKTMSEIYKTTQQGVRAIGAVKKHPT